MTRELEDWIEEHEYGKIASIAGHNDILDVEQDLTRLEAYYKVLACGDNTVTVSASDYIQLRYDISFHSLSLSHSLSFIHSPIRRRLDSHSCLSLS